MAKLIRRTVSVEAEDVSGATVKEKEHVWLLRGVDIEQIKKLATSSELQEQWSFMGPNANLRVRAIDNTTFIQTGKSWVDGVDGKDETQLETNLAMFKVFKSLATSGMVKRRYIVPYRGHTLEVDIFFEGHVPDGRPAEWCKVDLEVKDLSLPVPDLPFTAEEIIKDIPHNRPAELQQIVPQIYSTYFSVKK
jgi:CYTH domain-containing protein